MSVATALRRAPGRIAAGALILNSGLTDEERAKILHSSAAGAYPVVNDMEPKTFVKLLGAGETALGATLLLPTFPAALAGLGLSGFSGALLGFYWRTPGMHGAADPRPTHRGEQVRQGRLDVRHRRRPGDRRARLPEAQAQAEVQARPAEPSDLKSPYSIDFEG